MIRVFFAIDKYTEECGFVALHSMLRNASEKVSVTILYENHQKVPGGSWAKKLYKHGLEVDLVHQSVNNKHFGNCKDFFNSRANYLRLLAPLYACEERIIYSDADVIFTGDIADLYQMDLNGATISLFEAGTCGQRKPAELELLSKYGKKNENPYYASGLAVIDRLSYIKNKKPEACLDVIRHHGSKLIMQDQSVWNCVFSTNEVIKVEERWIQEPPIKKSDPPFKGEPGIVHFCGCPKPWDLLAEHMHASYPIWKKAAQSAGLRGIDFSKYLSKRYYEKAWRIRNQYKKFIK